MKRKPMSMPSVAKKMLQSGGTTAPRKFGNKHPVQPIGKAMMHGRNPKGSTSPGGKR